MIGEAGGHGGGGGGALLGGDVRGGRGGGGLWGARRVGGAMVGSGWGGVVVGPAEVEGGPAQPHAGGEGRLGASDGSTATGERCEVGAEGGIQALDVGGVDDGSRGGRRQHRLNAGQSAVD